MGVVLFQVQQIVPRGAGPQVSLFALSPEVRVTHHYFLEKRERQREPRLGAGRIIFNSLHMILIIRMVLYYHP